MLRKNKKRMRVAWIIISILGVIGMLGFTLGPLLQAF